MIVLAVLINIVFIAFLIWAFSGKSKKSDHPQVETLELNTNKVFELELCEKDTEYSNQLDKAFNDNRQSFSFTTIQNLSRNTGLWDELQNGIAQLNSHEQLVAYMFSYGKMHIAKLNQAFEILKDKHCLDLEGQLIEVIDYGCGQGIGTVSLIDFFKSNPALDFNIDTVKLIEPSRAALERASLHVQYSLKSANQPISIKCIECELDDLSGYSLEFENTAVKFHIFSNILDIENFDLQQLFETISSTLNGENYFICVSPNFSPGYLSSRNQRLVRFMEYFQNSFNTTVISERSNNIEKWTRFERIFKVETIEIKDTPHLEGSRPHYETPDDLPF